MSDAIPRKRTAAKIASIRRAGENKDNCSPPIRFYEPKLALDESEPEDVVHLKVKANVDEADSRINVSSLSFIKIKSFMLNGPLIVSQQHQMEQDIFIPEGMMDIKDLDKQYAKFNRILTDDARSSFVDILKNARATFLTERAEELSKERKESLLSRKDGQFFKWLKTEPDQENGPVNKNLLTGAECCTEFDRMVNFEIGKQAWETPHEVYEDHLRYLSNDIVKPLAMSVTELVLRFDRMYALKKFLPPPHKRDDDAEKANWKKQDVAVTFDEQRRSQFNALPTGYKEALKDKDEDWKSMSRQTWMQVLSRFETKDKAEREEQKTADHHNRALKKAKLEQLAKDSSKSHPKGANPRKKSSKYDQKRTSTGVARFCQLCKDADMPYAK